MPAYHGRLALSGKTENLAFEEPLIVEVRDARVRPNSEPFSPGAYLFFSAMSTGMRGIDGTRDGRRCNGPKHFRTIGSARNRNPRRRLAVCRRAADRPTTMPKPTPRLIELDFFRGLVLLVIVVDHIGGSILSRFTLHAYAMCDAAEVFVFLGGFATEPAYRSLAERPTEAVARQRFLRRALELYRAFLVTAVLMLVVTAVLTALRIDAP